MLADRLKTPPPKPRGHSCTVGLLLVELATQAGVTDDPTSEYIALVGALSSREWTSSDLERVVSAEGHLINVRHLRPHRSGQCTSANCPNPNVGTLTPQGRMS